MIVGDGFGTRAGIIALGALLLTWWLVHRYYTRHASRSRGSSVPFGGSMRMNPWTQNKALRVGGIAVAASYSIILLAAGHGVVPAGLILFFGAAPEWFPGIIFGWIAVILEILAFRRVGKKGWKRFAALAVGSFVTSATLFVLNSETLHYFGLFFGGFMAPFAIATIARIAQILSRKNGPNQALEPTSLRVVAHL
jgi:hypothetical protein